jgi:hypothetical protein
MYYHPVGYMVTIPKNTYLPSELNTASMSEMIISPITPDGNITIPKELMEKFNLKDFVEIGETHCNTGILIRKHE